MTRQRAKSVRTRGTMAALVLLCGLGCASAPVFRLPSPGNGPPGSASPDAAVGRVDLTGQAAAEERVDPDQQRRSVLFARARLLEADHQPEQAARLYEEILHEDPSHAAALHRLAVVTAEQGDVAAANGWFQKALHSGPDNAELRSDYGYFCYLVGRLDEAESHLAQAIALNPALSEAHNNLGLLSARRGETDRAIECCVQAGCTPQEARQNVMLVQQLESDREPMPEQRSPGSAVGRARIAD